MAAVTTSPLRPALVDYAEELRPPVLSDYLLAAATVVLLGLGLLMVYSTTGVVAGERFGDSLYYAKRHAVAVLLGLFLGAIATRLPLKVVRQISPWCLPITIFLLALPMIPGLGDNAGGATRWVSIGGMRFQPGEISKLTFVLFMAGFLARHEHKLQSFKQGIMMPLLLLAPVAVLYLVKPDFGSAAVLTLVVVVMIACAGARLTYLAGIGVLLTAGAAALVVTSPYRMSRIVSFLSPFSDAQGKGYQLIQSLIAIGSGEVNGVGIGASQQKLFFLPAAHTDFIFAVISEELGFAGALFVIAVFSVVLWRGLEIASRWADDTFCFSLALGLTLLIVLPAFLNMGVTTGLLPTKGMVLPLVAYGGSSLIASLFGIGLLLGLARHFQRTVR